MSSETSFPYKALFMGSSIVIGSLLFFYKLNRHRNSSSHRRKLIEHLTKKQIAITKRLEKLYEEEMEEKNIEHSHKKTSIDYSLPLNDPSLKAFSPLSIQENQKMKTEFNILGDYLNLQEHEYNGNYSFYFKDFNKLKEKISSMKADGVDQLQIVSDFDQTTTCFQINNKQSHSIFGTFRLSELTSQPFKKTLQSLYNSYAPIEIDPNIDIRHKKLLLKDWYQAVKEAFLHENITKQKCLSILNNADIGLRYIIIAIIFYYKMQLLFIYF